jgi:hypothetical protein
MLFEQFEQLDHSIIQNIIEFISFDTLIICYPKHAQKIFNPILYDYVWVNSIMDEYSRKRCFLWFIQNNKIPKDSFAIDILCKYGYVYLLDKMVEMILKHMDFMFFHKFYSHRALDWASYYNHIHILNWWFEWQQKTLCELKYSNVSIEAASSKGYIEVLDWWKKLYVKDIIRLKYSKDAIDRSYSIDVLCWWFNFHNAYGIELKYSHKHLDYCKDPNVFDFWYEVNNIYDLNFPMKYTKWCINNASANGYIDVLEWWKDHRHKLRIKYSEHVIDHASGNGQLDVLEWWKLNREIFPLHYTQYAIDMASANGHVHVLEWWLYHYKSGGLEFKRTERAINFASRNGRIKVLEWWLHAYRTHKIPFVYDKWAIEWAINDKELICWWIETCKRFNFKFETLDWDSYSSLKK